MRIIGVFGHLARMKLARLSPFRFGTTRSVITRSKRNLLSNANAWAPSPVSMTSWPWALRSWPNASRVMASSSTRRIIFHTISGYKCETRGFETFTFGLIGDGQSSKLLPLAKVAHYQTITARRMESGCCIDRDKSLFLDAMNIIEQQTM